MMSLHFSLWLIVIVVIIIVPLVTVDIAITVLCKQLACVVFVGYLVDLFLVVEILVITVADSNWSYKQHKRV
jgi:hypothetical protein